MNSTFKSSFNLTSYPVLLVLILFLTFFLRVFSINSPNTTTASPAPAINSSSSPPNYSSDSKPLAQVAVSTSRLAKLTRGVDLTLWFWVDNDQDPPIQSAHHYQTYISGSDLQLIKQLGFRHVRLSITPTSLFQEDTPDVFNPAVLPYLDKALDFILSYNLAVIVDMHFDSEGANFKARLVNEPAFAAKYALFWKTLAQHLSVRDPASVFLEVLNEPAAPDPQKWYEVQAKILIAMRQGAPEHTLIADANNETAQGDEEPASLLLMTPVQDPNVVYNFHFYVPGTFTGQGDAAAGLASVTGLPYPYNAQECQTAIAKLDDTSLAEDYCAEKWDTAKLETRVKAAADWAARNKINLIADEFGAYSYGVPAASRLRWIEDTRKLFDKYNIGWTLWGYDDAYGLNSHTETARPVLDMGVVQALGLGNYTYYLPLLSALAANSYTSYIRLQNAGATSANFAINYYSPQGKLVATDSSKDNPLNYNSQYLSAQLSSQNGVGSAIVTSDQPLNVVATVSGSVAGKLTTTSYPAINKIHDSTPSLSAPLILSRFQGNFSTRLILQNVGSKNTKVTVKYYNQGGTEAGSQTVGLESKQTVSVAQDDSARLPAGFRGWATVKSDNEQPLIGLILEINPDLAFFSTLACVGTPETKLHIPVVSQSTADSVVSQTTLINPNPQPANFTINYYSNDGIQLPGNKNTFQINAYSVFNFNHFQANFSGLATDVTSDQPLVALANQSSNSSNSNPDMFAGTVSLPTLGQNAVSAGFSPNLQLLNTTKVATSVTFTYEYSDGKLPTTTRLSQNGNPVVIPAGGLVEFPQSYLPHDFTGKLLVRADIQGASLVIVSNAASSQYFYSYT